MDERYVTETDYYAEQRAYEQATAVFDWQDLAEYRAETDQLRVEAESHYADLRAGRV